MFCGSGRAEGWWGDDPCDLAGPWRFKLWFGCGLVLVILQGLGVVEAFVN